MFFDGVAGEEAAECGRVVAVVVVDEVEFGVVVLRGPLERLRNVAGSGYVPERSVGIRCADVAGGTEDFADIFGDVVAVGEPGAVFLDRERTRRRRLRRIPGNTFRTRVVPEGVVLRRAVAALEHDSRQKILFKHCFPMVHLCFLFSPLAKISLRKTE